MGKKIAKQGRSESWSDGLETLKFRNEPVTEKTARCVYCLKFFEKLTRDHVYPESWYPPWYPANFPKPTVPSCKECNNNFGRIENRIKNQVGLCLNPLDPLGSHICQSAMRAVNPFMGKNVRDVTLRYQKREKVRRGILSGYEIPDRGVYPGFEIHPEIPKVYQGAIRISSNDLIVFTEKVIRGMTFLQDNHLISRPCSILSHAIDPQKVAPLEILFQRYGRECGFGPFFSVVRAVCDDRTTSIFRIRIWGRLVRYGYVGMVDQNAQFLSA